MSTGNSIAPGGREPEPPAEQFASDLPTELQSRYEVRLVDAPGEEQRIGLFRSGDRGTPSIEITADRIVARREDAETVDSLVKIARHNGWDRIDVDGSPEFRKAVWTAASREGLAVSGYEPSFAEREQVEAARRGAYARETRLGEAPAEQAARAAPDDPAASAKPPSAPAERSNVTTAAAVPDQRDPSDDDNRLLLRISALSEDRRLLVETLGLEMPRLAREVQVERVGENRERLATALDHALESPSLARSFERSGYPAEDLRGMAVANKWDDGIADAIYLVRTGLHRDAMARNDPEGRTEPGIGPEPRDEATPDVQRRDASERGSSPPVPEPSRVDRRDGGEDLAELFLHGSPESVAANPRLASAIHAQTAMEQHIDEVFAGDASRVASASLESRQMISDALRRGLDVSVREPTPVRQLEPAYSRTDLER